MEHIRTKYEATLKSPEGYEMHMDAHFDGNYMVGKEMWASCYDTDNKAWCKMKFFDPGKDEELTKLGFFKVLRLERVDIYEDRNRVY